MNFVFKLLLGFFVFVFISVCLPQKLLAEFSDTGIASFQLTQSKADQGDTDAQFNLGLLYYSGVGTPQDSKKAVYWLTKAAEQGHITAQYKLGNLYLHDDDGETHARDGPRPSGQVLVDRDPVEQRAECHGEEDPDVHGPSMVPDLDPSKPQVTLRSAPRRSNTTPLFRRAGGTPTRVARDSAACSSPGSR